MELWLVLLLLYALQCGCWLPRGATLFLRLPGGWRSSAGPGWRMLHPLPAGAAVVAARLPLVETESGLRGQGAASWLSDPVHDTPGPALVPGAGQPIEARGRTVRLDGRPLAGCATAEQATALAERLRELTRDGADASAWLEAELARGFDPASFEQARQRVAAATRGLAWTTSLYAAALFLGLPAAIAVWSEERALLVSLPVVAVLHLATLVSLGVSRRRLLAERAALGETLFSAACYPPLLLRGLHELRAALLSGWQPALVASALLPEAEARARLRGEWLRVATAEGGLPALERDALRGVLAHRGETPESLLAPPPRRDPSATGFCPACWSEYRRSDGECSDCGRALVAYAAEPQLKARA